MNHVSKALKGRLRVVAAVLTGLIVAGCASQVPLDSSASAPAPTSTASSSQSPSTAQEGAVSREIAAAKAALGAVEPSVYFDLDRFEIKSQYQATITAFANYLKADSKARIVIEGHADERGTTEYNLALGQKRAEAVSKALGILGVASSRVEAVSFGEEKPRASGSNEEAWAQNRRADLVLR
jgi:peptidoglycan-associated lipoprotein